MPEKNFTTSEKANKYMLNNDISRDRSKGVGSIYSEVGYLELGKKASYSIFSEQGSAKHKFVVGLCNDELGYIIPDNDFFLDSKLPYINNGKDNFDRSHYEEINSTGPDTARTFT